MMKANRKGSDGNKIRKTILKKHITFLSLYQMAISRFIYLPKQLRCCCSFFLFYFSTSFAFSLFSMEFSLHLTHINHKTILLGPVNVNLVIRYKNKTKQATTCAVNTKRRLHIQPHLSLVCVHLIMFALELGVYGNHAADATFNGF